MSYQLITQFDSPNYTPAAQTASVWGRNRVIQEIVIHWWGDPSTNPSFEGVVNYLCRANGSSSAHFVATGTGRRVACLVSPADNAWASNQDNPISIAIECDPRCRPEDIDVVAELIADLRATYGNLPLKGHRDIVATACPGAYNLARLNEVAATKIAHENWGETTTKTVNVPAKVTRAQIEAAYLEILERTADEGGIQTYLNSGFDIEKIKSELRNSQEYSILQNRKAAAQATAVEAAKKEAEEKAKAVAAAKEAERIAAEKAAQEEAKRLAEIEAARLAKIEADRLAAEKVAAEEAANNGGYTPADRERDNATSTLIQEIWKLLKSVWGSLTSLHKKVK